MLNAVANGTKRLRSSRDVDIYLVLFHVEGPRPGRTGSTSIFAFAFAYFHIYLAQNIVWRGDHLLKICVCRSLLLQWTKPPMCQSRGRSNFVLEILKLKMIRQYTSLILAPNLFILDCFWRKKKKEKGLLISISNAIFSILNFVSNSNKIYSNSKDGRDVYKNFNSKLI